MGQALPVLTRVGGCAGGTRVLWLMVMCAYTRAILPLPRLSALLCPCLVPLLFPSFSSFPHLHSSPAFIFPTSLIQTFLPHSRLP